MKLGLRISKSEFEPKTENPRFVLRGHIYSEQFNYASYVVVKGYLGRSGDSIHITELPTYNVKAQKEIMDYIVENHDSILKSVKSTNKKLLKENSK